ncbi:7-carboxy-7-deazaguanine synthase QueE [Yinghuangia sp. ASG 101]|uniref:7-carboxy-7-deazaguanine synthase QueE n=1 Tax=Yinghuangia sp. ASG 101 TaxID=2896848 RepID=UPI001E4E8F02|nr:7-carboxy-7-deazaguanine synthase QueE [Yinghuangia sp. ASG 101]UGQ10504.1 7-carboxy-7-deazaguanine synthase QueE [Yinghuangia sp. ASG 101]
MSRAGAILRRAAGAGELVVNERFVSHQGEGPSQGRAAVFVRLGGCNLACAGWPCDTPQTWRWDDHDPAEELHPTPVAELATWVLAQSPGMVVITGGEPLMQQRQLVPLVRVLYEAGRRVEFETNGTLAPLPEIAAAAAQFTVSPKLASSGEQAGRRIRHDVLAVFADTRKAVFKFVVSDGPEGADWAELAELVESHQLAPVWVMPQGTTSEEVLAGAQALAAPAAEHGWHVSLRLQVLLGVR